MKKILVIGECMLELKETSANSMAKCFAGDVYNTAVYAKRWASTVDVSFLTAIGEDPISQSFIKTCHNEEINSEAILSTTSAHMGIYAISTDELGERSFTYWRNQSAAKQIMQLLAGNYSFLTACHYDVVYFSGISLAILSNEDRGLLLALIEQLKTAGAKIAFDPNYRAHMWQGKREAIEWIEKSYACSDIVLPGLEDHQNLLGHNSAKEIRLYMNKFPVSEMIIKCGNDGVYGYGETNVAEHLPFSPAKTQVDSTAAGDSFAGTYLAARLEGTSIKQAIIHAANTAKFVIQHHGAIVEKATFANYLTHKIKA
jgi:2-dehydro-3-deoxygluconokinase